jgi:hypothetical protein
MKIRITGLPKGFELEGLSPDKLNEMISTSKPPKPVLKKMNESVDTNKKTSRLGNEKWQKEYYTPFKEWLKKNKGVDVDFKTHEQYQQAIAKYDPDLLLNKLKSGEMALTNRHREILGLSNDVTDFTEIPKEKLKEIGQNLDNVLIDGYIDTFPGHRGLNATDFENYKPKENVVETKAEEIVNLAVNPESGLNYKFENNDINNPYQRRQLPFYQVAPDLANFAAANDMYNYWTPDYTRQEIQPPTLNIQDQLNSIDASLNAVNRTTTGNPLLDQARKQSAFSQILQAKDSAYARKQNYDAEGRFKADSFNIDARNTEMINDINAASKISNEYVAEAKDNMTYEKMASIQNMYRKYGLNEATENRYEILSKMFPQMKWNSKTGSGEFQSNPADFNFLNRNNDIPASNTNSKNTQPKTITNKVNAFNPNMKELDNSYNLIDQSLNNIGLFPEDSDLINKYGR